MFLFRYHRRTFRHSGSKLLQCFMVHHRTFQHSGSKLLQCFVVHHRTFQHSGGELLHRLFRGWLQVKVCLQRIVWSVFLEQDLMLMVLSKDTEESG